MVIKSRMEFNLFGALEEWYQLFVPGRSMSAGDVLADGIGSVLTIILLHGIGYVQERQYSSQN